jgi:hypothetical protein
MIILAELGKYYNRKMQKKWGKTPTLNQCFCSIFLRRNLLDLLNGSLLVHNNMNRKMMVIMAKTLFGFLPSFFT